MNYEEKAKKMSSYFEKFISEQVATGRFASNEEVLQAGLRLLEEQQLNFHAKKAELNDKDVMPKGELEAPFGSASEVSQILTDAVRAMSSVDKSNAQAIPAIPTTKGLLRSQIAAE